MHPLIPYFDAANLRIFGLFTIKIPGLLLVLGFAAATFISVRKARRDNLEHKLILRVNAWLLAGIFVGGHLGHLIFYYPELLRSDPANVFRIWNGMSSFGGFITCTALAIWFFRSEARKRRNAGGPHPRPIDIWAYIDVILYGFTLGWFFGRLGCFSVHDHPGVETRFWLGVYGICPSGAPDVACHDLGLYEAIWSLVMFLIFIILDRKPRFPGFFTGIITISYGPCRFLLDMLRHPAIDARYFGFTPAQYGSIVLTILGLLIFSRRSKIAPVRVLDITET